MDPKTEQDKAATDAPTDAKAGGTTGAGESGATGEGQPPLSDELQRQLDRVTSKMYEKMQRQFEERLEAEKKRISDERLREQGEFQKLFEERDAELRAVRAQQAADKFRADALQTLTEMQIPEFTDVLLTPVDSLAGLRKHAEALKATIDKRVEEEVARRLDTGKRPQNGSPAGGETKRVQDMDERDKARIIKEKGLEHYLQTVLEQ